jgi:transcriptional regulator with XRE-family HTH domain
MGFCISCGQWIGRKYNKHHSDVRHDELLSQTWIHDQLGKLFSDAQRMPSPPEREVVTSFISRCVKVLAGGGFSNLDRALGMSASTVSGWLSGKHSPALGALLKLCFLSKVSLSDVLTGNINFNREPLESQVIVNAIVRHADSSRAKITTKLSDIEKALKNSLNSDSPPPTFATCGLAFKNLLRWAEVSLPRFEPFDSGKT